MSHGEQPDPRTRLDALFDGQLAADEREALLRALGNDAAVLDELRLQQQIDGALGRLYDAPLPDAAWFAALASRGAVPETTDAVGRASWSARLGAMFSSRLGVVAALVVAAAAAWGAVAYQFLPSRPATPHCVPQPLEHVYAATVAAGFRPEWSTGHAADFAQACESRPGRGAALGPLPAGVEMTGMSYLPGLGPHTLALLARVDGEPVIVFVGSADSARSTAEPPAGTPLRRFQRSLGDVTLVEVTPFDAPRILPAFQLAAADAAQR